MPEKSENPRIDSRPDPDLPPIDYGANLVEYLFQAGPALNTGMGRVPIGQRDLQAWQQNQEIELDPWECSTILKLSRIYTNGLSEYAKVNAPPPWVAEVSEAKLQVATDGLKNWLGSLKSR